jgi:hypothetical protein
MQQLLLTFEQRQKKMTDPKTRFEKVKLEELKKILPEQVVDGNENHRGRQKDKKKNKQRVAETSTPKSKV